MEETDIEQTKQKCQINISLQNDKCYAEFKNTQWQEGELYQGIGESSFEEMLLMPASEKTVSQIKKGKRENIPSRGKMGQTAQGKKENGSFEELKDQGGCTLKSKGKSGRNMVQK